MGCEAALGGGSAHWGVHFVIALALQAVDIDGRDYGLAMSRGACRKYGR